MDLDKMYSEFYRFRPILEALEPMLPEIQKKSEEAVARQAKEAEAAEAKAAAEEAKEEHATEQEESGKEAGEDDDDERGSRQRLGPGRGRR